MIGKASWFRTRRYGGWGITPITWQGWVYVVLTIGPFILFQSLPFWEESTRMVVTVFWLSFLLLDVGHIMITLHRDEREKKLEALSERNASWFMAIVLVIGIVYEIITSALQENVSVNLFMIVALFGGAIVKTISSIVFERRLL